VNDPRRFVPLALVLAVLWCAGSRAQEPAKEDVKAPEATSFLRVQTDDAGKPLALETAVVRYVPADGKHEGLSVDLIGAVHVGDKRYYEKLNERFQQYDALLFELVAAEADLSRLGEARETEVSGGGAIMALQTGMKGFLELEHQLEQIDYKAKNFVHADMSPEEFNRSMKDRKESFFKLFLRMFAQAQSAQGKKDTPSDAELLAALFSKNRALEMKRLMAQQFSDLESHLAALEGPDGSTLITVRNQKALEVLDREIKAGKKKIGIFYGAGHLANMEQRLFKDFGLKREAVQWVEAWDLRGADGDGDKDKPKGPLRAIFEALTK
jgi:hypothetical protein